MEIHVAYTVLAQHFDSAFRDPLFILYIAAVLVDIVLGNIKAWTMNDVDSHVGVRGTLKHAGVFSFVVILLPPLSYYLGNNAISLGILGYLVYQYVISIIENLGAMGYKMPEIFEKSLRRLNEEDKEKGEK